MTKLEAAVSENKVVWCSWLAQTQLQSFAKNCDFLLSSPWLQALDSNKIDFSKEMWNFQFLGSNMQYAKSYPSQLSCQFLMFILLLRTVIIHGLCCYVHFHDKKEKVEIWTESRCLAGVSADLVESLQNDGKHVGSIPLCQLQCTKRLDLNCSWNPDPPSQLQALEWETGENLAVPS